ncbi:hypothetical protein [Ruminococcus sp.]|uniref:hypothetical protein n=1 Tax=Ruminococcus sp. TaxID=41978 RepID=UPI001B43B2CB|nr:hypothetical protein [Ruminococcus sp.]MBP5432217.1 hypothetical protein [Ruminococcus sp.]
MPYSSNDINKNYDIARQWAEQQAESEAEAFEKAIKRLKAEDTIKELTAKVIQLEHENYSLKSQVKKLREALNKV